MLFVTILTYMIKLFMVLVRVGVDPPAFDVREFSETPTANDLTDNSAWSCSDIPWQVNNN